ncbi:MAG: hypothetical protein HYV09_26395 [Deltaproteobacteria bacterium]|nr:hypothetical protein [Deltaproteobacteria bacterium]
MNGPARAPLALGLVLLAFSAASSACSPNRDGSRAPASVATAATAATGKWAPRDRAACEDICDASAACGDSAASCLTRCNEWLIKRSRPGIASATARCAVPRIDDACEQSAARGAARALVACVDEAGRQALSKDKETLLVAARAICDRGARCGGGSSTDANQCVSRLLSAKPAPRGLGIFGAIKPELVSDFADCMETSNCGPAGAACFGEMLGETTAPSDSDPATPEEKPSGPGEPPPVEGGTKI